MLFAPAALRIYEAPQGAADVLAALGCSFALRVVVGDKNFSVDVSGARGRVWLAALISFRKLPMSTA